MFGVCSMLASAGLYDMAHSVQGFKYLPELPAFD
jgi:hypothetical protein